MTKGKTKNSVLKGLTPEKEIKRWSKSFSIGDAREEINVEKIDNGFLVSYYKEWYDEKKGYRSFRKKVFSNKNPLGDEYQVSESKSALKDIIDNLD